MQKNEVYEVQITSMTDEGDGVGRVEDMAVFVPYTLVGERVKILIVKVLKRFAYGKLLEVLSPSVHRTKAACPHFYQCGGCQLWHMDMEAELAYKRQKVTDCLERIGKLDIQAELVVLASEEVRYRNKAQFPVSEEGIGFYRRNSHAVIDMEDCLIQGAWNRKIVRCVKAWMAQYNIAPYHEKTHTGLIRHIYTRKGNGGILVTLVATQKELPHREELMDALCGLNLPICGVLVNVNNQRTNVVLGKETKTLFGEPWVTDALGEVEFQISPLSFYQVNKDATLCLYELVKHFAGLDGRQTVWDLYCGIGTIGLFLADKAQKVIGVEIVPDAVKNAEENAKRNGFSNTEYHCGKAEVLAPRLVKRHGRPDVVILDPPRKGCDEALLKTVAEVMPKRVVYVSCKPSTLARDLHYLCDNGYEVKRVVPVNMFPKTSHVETVVLLQRQNT